MRIKLSLIGSLFFYSVGVFAPDWDRLLAGQLNEGRINGKLPRNPKFFFRDGRQNRPGTVTGMGKGGILQYLKFNSRGIIANSGGVLLNPETIRILAAMKVEKARVRKVVEDCLKARKGMTKK